MSLWIDGVSSKVRERTDQSPKVGIVCDAMMKGICECYSLKENKMTKWALGLERIINNDQHIFIENDQRIFIRLVEQANMHFGMLCVSVTIAVDLVTIALRHIVSKCYNGC